MSTKLKQTVYKNGAIKVLRLATKEQIEDLSTAKAYVYIVDGKEYTVYDGKITKICVGPDYNYIFDKTNGNFKRFGKTYAEDPTYSPIGPEIWDCEASTICYGVSGNSGDNNVKSPCKFCSPAGTKINTVNDFKDIENIVNGDLVIGYDQKTKSIKIQEVKETYKRHYQGEIICIETENGILKLTPEHIVILVGGIEKQAKDIDLDDEIISF